MAVRGGPRQEPVDPVNPDEPAALNVGLLLFIPYRAMETRVLEVLVGSGFADLTLAQAKLMQRVDEGGTRLTRLAAAAQVTKQTAGFLVDQLERAGYVRRVTDPTDARARLVMLAERGRAAVELAGGEVAAVEAEWRDHLGPGRFRDLQAALTQLRELTDPYR